MMVIRPEQVAALAQAARLPFEQQVEQLVRTAYPETCATLGDSGTAAAVRDAIVRAERHGFTTARQAWLYVDLVFTFGTGLETEPEYWWARPFLGGDAPASVRIERLFDAATGRRHNGRGLLGDGRR